MNFLKAMFGNYSKREVKRVQPICDKVLALEDKYAAMSESELKNQTAILKERLANGETTDDILPEAFATCREAGWRVLGMKHFPVQIIGGIVLHQGRIAEMKTGEGKTLVATLPAYLNALTGEGVHIVTVNDYLARRDSEWMGKLYRYLGLSVGLICHDLDNEGRKKAFDAATNFAANIYKPDSAKVESFYTYVHAPYESYRIECSYGGDLIDCTSEDATCPTCNSNS